MNLGLRQKFSLLAFLAGGLFAVMSVIGYYTSFLNLSETLTSEILAVVDSQGKEMDTWLKSKAVAAQYTADLLGNLGDINRMKNRDLQGLTTSDKDILEVTIGLRDKYFFGYNAGDFTGKIDPTGRPWYNDAKNKNGLTFTEAYLDSFTKKLVVSAVAPIKIGGEFVGATCVDISLDVLNDQIKKSKYRGQGDGVLFERSGNVLATTTSRGAKSAQEIPGISDHFSEMLTNGTGYFSLPEDQMFGDRVFAYTTIESTGWILGIAVSEDFILGAIKTLRTTYAILGIVGVLLMIIACMQMASSITKPIEQLRQHAVELSKGNLRLQDIVVRSKDEIGELSTAFNEMSASLRNLIGQMSHTSHQVAASSEELTANAQQSADTSVHISENVAEVSGNMNRQLSDISSAKDNVDIVFKDIENMSEKTKLVTKTSNETAEAALRGEQLMETAVEKMSNIEQSVMASAKVVKQLGDNSKQIGQIIEAISSISEQTNLLALNAAIEAARAGEAGKGFAVVAEEVRKLAAESQTSAEQIRERILNIQNDTVLAVDAMETGTRDVKEGTAAIHEVGEQFKQIMQRVENIKQQMEGIGVSMRTVSKGASQIVTAVDSIDEVSRKTSEYTNSISNDTETQSASNEEIAAASQALAQLAVEMQNAIDKFKM